MDHCLVAPGRVDHPLGMLFRELLEIPAIDPVDRDAASASHEAFDRIGRRRLAAAAQRGHQLADPDDQDPVAGIGGMAATDVDFRFGWLHPGIILGLAQRGMHRTRAQFATAGGQVHRLGILEAQPAGQFIQTGVGVPFALHLAGHHAAPACQQLLLFELAEVLLDLLPRACGRDIALARIEPVSRRPAFLGRDDLDGLPAGQRGVERQQMAIDLGAAAAMPQIAVQPVGEIDRCRTARQIDDPTLRGQHIQGVVERGALELLDPVRRIGDLVAPAQEIAQQRDLLVVVAAVTAAFLVAPVRGDAVFGMLVHRMGADLHLQRAPVAGQHRGVQRLVVVALGLQDVVVVLVRDRVPHLMHDAEHRVAVLDLRHQHPQRADVVDLREVQLLGAHLVVDAVDVLGPALDFGADADRGQFAAQPLDRLVDEALALDPALIEHLRDPFVGFGLQEAEGQILQLPLELPDPEPVGQRRVDVQALAGHLGARLAGLVGIVAQGLGARGQPQQHHPDVLDHREQHLAQHLALRADFRRGGIRGGAGDHPQAVQAAQAFDQTGDLGVVVVLELLQR